MAPLGFILFGALFIFGEKVFGWSDYQHFIRIALAASFVLGMVAGYRPR